MFKQSFLPQIMKHNLKFESTQTLSENQLLSSPSSITQSMEESQVPESDNIDRLSELPDSLILLILSFLEMRDVVRTTILSKRWKDLWIAVPSLQFFRYVDSYSLNSHRKFICGALARWEGAKIQKFGLVYHQDPESESEDDYGSDFDSDSDSHETTSDIDPWLLFAIEKQVEELVLDLGFYRDSAFLRDGEYCLPQRLYSCSSIRKLSLFRCQLRIEEIVRWDQLKSLTIDGIESWSEEAMSRVVSGAPQLEELVLRVREIVEDLVIRSESLRSLKIGDYGCFDETNVAGVVTIWAPSLASLEISGYFYDGCLLDVPSLSNALVCFRSEGNEMKSGDFSSFEMLNQVFPSICHVVKVELADWCIKFLLYMKGNHMLVLFSKAKLLDIYAGEINNGPPQKDPKVKMCEMLDVLEMFPKLTKLTAQLEEDEMTLLFEEPDAPKVYTRKSLRSKATPPGSSLLQLKTADIMWCIRDASLFPAMESLLKTACVLEKMVVRLEMHAADPKKFVVAKKKVLRMRRASRRAEVIIIEV